MVSDGSAARAAYLAQLYGEDRREHAYRGGDLADWAAVARPALRRVLRLDAIAADYGGFRPRVTIGEAVLLDGYARYAGTLESEPGFEVPFWYLRPDGDGPHPVALFPHGHYQQHGLDYAVGVASTDAMRAKIVAEDRDVAVQAVRRGYACLAPATRGFLPAAIPDVTGRHGQSNCRSQLMHALLAGRTAVGERVWDLQCLLDWAAAQPQHDLSDVLMMGNSGGGVTTLYAAACDERVTCAVASCSYCSLVGLDGAIHHCDCNAVPGILRFGELWDVGGLIAPRRLLVVHGATDPLFPTPESERAVLRLRMIYESAGCAAAFHHATGDGGHRFYAALMWPFVEARRTSRI